MLCVYLWSGSEEALRGISEGSELLGGPQLLFLALPAQPLMSPEVTGAPHVRGIRVRKVTGEKQAGLEANERAVEEPNLCMLPTWQEVGVGGSWGLCRKRLECEVGRDWGVERYLTAPECTWQAPWMEGDRQRRPPFSFWTQFYRAQSKEVSALTHISVKRSQDSPGVRTKNALGLGDLGQHWEEGLELAQLLGPRLDQGKLSAHVNPLKAWKMWPCGCTVVSNRCTPGFLIDSH